MRVEGLVNKGIGPFFVRLGNRITKIWRMLGRKETNIIKRPLPKEGFSRKKSGENGPETVKN